MDVQHVSYAVGKTTILTDVSLSVPHGGFVGIIGPNGAGKSTLMRIMAGLMRPSRGRITFEGRPLIEWNDRERARHIAFVRQNPHIGFGFSVDEVVAMGRYPHRNRWESLTRTDRETIQEAMELAGVDHLRKRRMTELSGGERQRVFLARAMVQQPRLLFLDEPTANLDIRYELDILNLIAKLNRDEGLTVVMAVHDLVLAARYTDALIALNQGMVAARGIPRQVVTEDVIEEVFHVSARIDYDPVTKRLLRVDYEPLCDSSQ